MSRINVCSVTAQMTTVDVMRDLGLLSSVLNPHSDNTAHLSADY